MACAMVTVCPPTEMDWPSPLTVRDWPEVPSGIVRGMAEHESKIERPARKEGIWTMMKVAKGI